MILIKNHILYTDFTGWRFEISKAEGSFLWDEHGKKYIDFISGWNVTNLGWNHPEVNEAVARQAKKNVYNPMWTSINVQEEYAKKLLSVLPKKLNTVCRATGGTEANEEALKIARAATGRKKIIGFKDSYHGQSFATMALGYRPEYVKAISPLVPDFIQIDFPDTYKINKDETQVLKEFLDNLEEILAKKDVAAILTEAGIITGWGSCLVAPNGYLQAVRDLTKKYGTLLILDEVGTGFSRIGRLFGMEREGVVPDIVTLAKGISNGAAAIGAVVTSSDLVEPVISKTNLTSTFGWTGVACAAALKTLEIHLRDKVWEQAARKGEYLLTTLRKKLLKHPHIRDIRGVGMEIGIDFVEDRKTQKKNSKIIDEMIRIAFRNGLHIIRGSETVIQIMPPLTILQEVLDEGIEILVNSISRAFTSTAHLMKR